MIIGSLKNTTRIEKMHPRFKAFFDYIKNIDIVKLDLGKTIVDGDDLFVISALLDGKKKEEAALEAHREYIDIQLLLEGDEAISWAPLEDAEEVLMPYDADNDIVFFSGEPHNTVKLRPGQFAVLFPEDLHGPGISEGKIRKIIAKVRK